jgi:two-component system chemotaxis response regulator CheB
MIKVLVVDDSAFMRRAIKKMVESDPGIEVVGTARDGAEGVEMAMELRPDVITMDVEMPRLNGLEAVELIMEKNPTPILMVSSLTTEGAKATLDALDKGAVDYISKNLVTSALDLMKIETELTGKIKAVARKKSMIARAARRIAAPARKVVLPERKSFATQKVAFVAIGASTGGPRAIQAILTNLPEGLPTPFVVAVHMPQAFTGAFAERLNGICKLTVKEAENGEPIKAGQVLLTPGGRQTKIRKKGVVETYVEVSEEPRDAIYKPSVDVTMISVAESYPGRSMGVILTGMGHDGVAGMKLIKEKGGKTIAQDEESCTVYGMPKAVVDAGLADKVVSLDKMAAEIVNMI